MPSLRRIHALANHRRSPPLEVKTTAVRPAAAEAESRRDVRHRRKSGRPLGRPWVECVAPAGSQRPRFLAPQTLIRSPKPPIAYTPPGATTPLPRTPSPNGPGVQLRSGLWKLPPLTRAWTRLRSSPRGNARPHPLGKRFAFPTGPWTRFFEVQSRVPRPQLPQAPPAGYILRVSTIGSLVTFSDGLTRTASSGDHPSGLH